MQAALLHGAIYAQILARDLLAEGVAERDLFGDSGFTADLLAQEKPVADYRQVATFFEHAARLTGNDLLGFQRGQQREMRRAGLICFVGLSAPTLRDFILNTTRYRRVYSDAVETDHSLLDSDGVIRWYYNVPVNVVRRQHIEFATAGMLRGMRVCTDRQLRPELVTFRHQRKTHHDVFERYFGCDVQFGCEHNSYRFRRSDLDLPLVTADEDLYAVLRDCCEDVLKRKGRKVPALVAEVERAVAGRLASGQATQQIVARSLGMSPRTLSRRLAGDGTTYFQILDDLRKALATGFLQETDLSLSEIAYLLGYAGLSSFNDAFRRWTGQTPGRFRGA